MCLQKHDTSGIEGIANGVPKNLEETYPQQKYDTYLLINSISVFKVTILHNNTHAKQYFVRKIFHLKIVAIFGRQRNTTEDTRIGNLEYKRIFKPCVYTTVKQDYVSSVG